MEHASKVAFVIGSAVIALGFSGSHITRAPHFAARAIATPVASSTGPVMAEIMSHRDLTVACVNDPSTCGK